MDDDVVEFVCHPDILGDIPEPMPASRVLPFWYESLDMVVDCGEFTDRTVRACPSFLDALSLGWIVPFDRDIEVLTTESGVDFSDGVTNFMVGSDNLPDDVVASVTFESRWSVIVPDGYSLLITTPMNRSERRFRVVSRLLDADNTVTQLDVPVFWTAGDANTIIKRGSPMCQVIPLCRESRIDRASVEPLGPRGEEVLHHVRKRTKVDNSWYRTKEWSPKATRVLQDT